MNRELIKATLKKGEIDEGMEQIVELLMQYNINNEDWISDAIYHLLYHSVGSKIIRGEEE